MTERDLTARLGECLRGETASFAEWTTTEVMEGAAAQGVTALLADRLAGRRGEEQGLVELLQRERALGSALDLLRAREVHRVLSALDGAGIRSVLVKGSALAWTLYEDPGLRPRFDTDVFLRREDADAAAQAMTSLGYRRPAQVTGALVMHQVDYVRTDPSGVRHVFDFHWKLSNRQAVADVLSFDEVLAASAPIPGLEGVGRAPSLVHSLVLACVHRVAHHSAEERLIWLYDIHLLAEALSAADAQALVSLSRERSVTLICADGLLAARRAFQTTLPAGMLERLTPAGRTASEPSAALLVEQPTLARELLSDLRAIRWGQRVRLLREHAFPSAQYMSAAYMTSSRALLPALYTHRLVRGAWRLLRGASR
jgi:hypothetical protein